MEVLNIDIKKSNMRRNIWLLAWPAILRFFLQSLVGTVDVIMVGRVEGPSIGAVGVGNRIVFIIIGVFTALSVGATALVAHHIGAKNTKKGNEILWQSIMISFIMGVIICLIGLFFAEYLVKGLLLLMEKSEDQEYLIHHGSIYVKIVLASMIVNFPMMIITAIFQGVGDTRTPLILMIVSNIINVMFNYFLIFGKWIFPELGVAGAALGTAIAHTAGCFIALTILYIGKSNLKLSFKSLKLKLDFAIIKAIFKIGIPSSIEQFARQFSQVIIAVFVAALGSVALQANEIAMNISNLAILPGFGFSVASLTLVGQSLGANRKDLATKYTKETSLLGVFLMIPISIIMFILAEPLVKLYSPTPEILPLSILVVRIVVIMQPVLTLIFILAGALRGAGDTLWVMIITIVGNWFARVAIGVTLGYFIGIGLVGFYIAMAIDMFIRVSMMIIRFKSGKWQNIRVIDKKGKLKDVIYQE